jgi:AmmeMemoRadiSam system protein B
MASLSNVENRLSAGLSMKVFVCSIVLCVSAFAQEIRPVRDDVGYCWDAEQMKRLVDYLAPLETDSMPTEGLVAAISPHDDYLYAAREYYPLFRAIRAKEIVVFGVTHGTVRKEIGNPQNVLILDEYKAWHGLTGNVTISPLREFIKSRLDTSLFIVSNKAQQLEHSIEAMIPFLQYFNPDIRLTPVMVTAMPFERMEKVSEALADVLADYVRKGHLVLGKDILFLMSSDANHYGKDFENTPFGEDSMAHWKATEEDARISRSYVADIVTSQKIHSLTNELKNVVWCGRYSVPFGLLTAQKAVKKLTGREITGKVIRYSDSYSEGVIPLVQTGMGTTAPFSLKHWVGYLSAAFYLK